MDKTDEIKVGISDLNIASEKQSLMTAGLGSCIGIALYDKTKHIAGLSHIMLPDSSQFKNQNSPMKFADTAIPLLLSRMAEAGCKKENITAKIAGGASMFKFAESKLTSSIGDRNIEAVKIVLKEMNIPIISEDTGGSCGRTMYVYAETGKVMLKIVGTGLKEL